MKPQPTFTIDEIEALLAQQPQRDPKLEGFTSTELLEAIAEATGELHCKNWARKHYIRPLVLAGIAEPASLARKPLCSLHWTHIQGYKLVKEGEA